MKAKFFVCTEDYEVMLFDYRVMFECTNGSEHFEIVLADRNDKHCHGDSRRKIMVTEKRNGLRSYCRVSLGDSISGLCKVQYREDENED